jgi:hypothetical protein
VKPLVDIARTAPKEKVFRISLSALRNLLSTQEPAHTRLASDMVEAGLPKVVATRKLQVRSVTLECLTCDCTLCCIKA